MAGRLAVSHAAAMAFDPDAGGSAPPIAVVLPGGGARGAYEIGALSVLLPALHERGERVSILCGTSVGAINAVLLASLADRPPAEQVQVALERWRGMRKRDVMAPVVGPGMLVTLARMAGEALEIPGLRLGGLLDAGPMRTSVKRWVDWLALHRNVKSGRVDAVCVMATALSSGASVAFVETRRRAPRSHPGDDVRYVRVALDGEHVRASAAIPVLFPPVRVDEPRAARDHYIDGGTRLNSPIKPALALGAERIVVIGFEPFAGLARLPVAPREPRLADVAANILDGLLVDQVGADLRRLAAVNTFFVDGPGAGPSRAARAYRTARGHKPYRRISYALVAPREPGELGRIAEDVFRRRYGGLRGLLSPDYPLISRLLGGRTRGRGELLSFLLFDPMFTERLIEAGRADAQRWLDRHPRFWCSDAAHDLEFDPFDDARVREEQALDEFRKLRRR
jgi:NTE family protein